MKVTKINFTDSFKQFLKDSKDKNSISRLLYNSQFNNYDYDNGVKFEFTSWNLLITTNEIDYITFRNDGTISYLPAGKEHVTNDNGNWAKDNRQSGKPSKVIRKLFTKKALSILKDKDFEQFTNLYKNNYSSDGYKLELKPNTEIANVYCMDRVNDGTIGNSCMNGDSEYLDIYVNCEKLSILTLINRDGLLCGRSLVWKVNDEITLMDRIYVSQDFLYETFLDYAIKNNYWRKRDYKSYDNKKHLVNPQGEEIYKTLRVYTDTDFDYFPYIDTFSFGGDGYLTNESGQDYCYNETDGRRGGDHNGQVYDDINDEWIDEDDAVYIEYGERRYRGRNTHCDNCVCVNGTWYHENDENIAEVNGNYYKIDDGEICNINGEWYLTGDCVYSESEGDDILIDDAIEIDDEWYRRDSNDIIEVNDTWYRKDSDELIEIDDTFYHKEEDTDNDIICEIDGEWYLTDSEEISKDEEGNYILLQLN